MLHKHIQETLQSDAKHLISLFGKRLLAGNSINSVPVQMVVKKYIQTKKWVKVKLIDYHPHKTPNMTVQLRKASSNF
jgi:hypothetical protein